MVLNPTDFLGYAPYEVWWHIARTQRWMSVVLPFFRQYYGLVTKNGYSQYTEQERKLLISMINHHFHYLHTITRKMILMSPTEFLKLSFDFWADPRYQKFLKEYYQFVIGRVCTVSKPRQV